MELYFSYYIILIMALVSVLQEYKNQDGEMTSVWYLVSAFIIAFIHYLFSLWNSSL